MLLCFVQRNTEYCVAFLHQWVHGMCCIAPLYSLLLKHPQSIYYSTSTTPMQSLTLIPNAALVFLFMYDVQQSTDTDLEFLCSEVVRGTAECTWTQTNIQPTSNYIILCNFTTTDSIIKNTSLPGSELSANFNKLTPATFYTCTLIAKAASATVTEYETFLTGDI